MRPHPALWRRLFGVAPPAQLSSRSTLRRLLPASFNAPFAKHIVTSKAGHFEPPESVDRYEVEVVELLKKKQAGLPAKKEPARTTLPKGGNIIDLLKRSLEMEGKRPKVKAPPIVPSKARATTKKRASA